VGDSWRDWPITDLRQANHKPFDDGQIEDKMTHAETVLHNLSIVLFFVLQFLIIDQVVVDPFFLKPSKTCKKSPLSRYHHNDLSHDSEAVQPVASK